ncbi:hypothetical protein BOX15_Mlig008976g1, partial [Macrostomum lignano]
KQSKHLQSCKGRTATGASHSGEMATPASSSLGKDLESLGKALNACKKIQEINKNLKRAKEQLKSVENGADSINVALPTLQKFKNAVRDCLRIAESLYGQVTGIAKDHSKCLEELKKTANSGTLTNENVESMKNALTKLVEDFERFGRELGEFVEHTKELRRVSERVNDEASREKEKFRKEAASTRSEANWKNFYQWMELINTFGLITLTSYYQDSVDANSSQYKKVDELDKLFRKFEKARKLLDVALQKINGVGERIGSRPVQLTEDVIQIIQSVLLQYEKISEAQQQAAQSQQQAAQSQQQAAQSQQKTVEAEERAARAEEENAKMKEELERMRKKMEAMKKNQGK